jgi:hypothetical protein
MITPAFVCEINMNERRRDVLGSTGCQPVVFGSLPKSSWNLRGVAVLPSVGGRRQAAHDNRLAACAPQNRNSPLQPKI